VQYELS